METKNKTRFIIRTEKILYKSEGAGDYRNQKQTAQ